MTEPPAIGFTLQPEERMLELLGALLREEPDYYELAPETAWRPMPADAQDGAPLERALKRLCLGLADRLGGLVFAQVRPPDGAECFGDEPGLGLLE